MPATGETAEGAFCQWARQMSKPEITRFYGRRKGKPLRDNRQRLIDEKLPGIRPVLPDEGSVNLAQLFGHDGPYWLEVGFGGGEHLAAQAAQHPDVGFLGCEPFINGVGSLLRHVDEQGLSNVRIWDEDARLLLPELPAASISRAFLLFSDPWPKVRHHRRRFVQPETLDMLARLLKPGTEFRFASDHMGHVSWALEHILRHGAFQWTAQGSGDWRRRPPDGVPTRYEEKALGDGKPCVYLSFLRS